MLPLETLGWLLICLEPQPYKIIFAEVLEVHYPVPCDDVHSPTLFGQFVKGLNDHVRINSSWWAHYLACISEVPPPFVLNKKAFFSASSTGIDKGDGQNLSNKSHAPKLVPFQPAFAFDQLVFEFF
jgi:hypothetical protein